MNWFALAALAFLGFGLTNLMFKVGERVGANIAILTIVLYLLGAIFSVIWFTSQKQLDLNILQTKPLVIGAFAAVFSITGTIAVQQALRNGPASLIYPIVGLSALIVITASLLLFKEVITPKQLIGVVFALIAVFLISSK
jgi:uncharacterized membrane protein